MELRRIGDAKNPAATGELALSKAQWHEDLKFLVRELPKRHVNAFQHISRERSDAEVTGLDRKLDHLNSDEIYVGMNRLANLIRGTTTGPA